MVGAPHRHSLAQSLSKSASSRTEGATSSSDEGGAAGLVECSEVLVGGALEAVHLREGDLLFVEL